ncbi:PREDICTED: uncharacterized protein LOC104807903 [Tarenaya hassleriana]|uniref:uncharacterized protein LOC104807903 n=1 Tax=Tarenaya hassleriana TaxID=28532 RepID=UPI00053C7636|nr:PREDICTED: uncharacterized protein LOC104807903 [Tarenaya hassleriana]XP_010531652.1 PREDICTED: uncharacterized protein LOC104807903 [Tarenaya hassleriana]
MEIPSGKMPAQCNSTTELSVGYTSFSKSNVEVGEDDYAFSDHPQRLSYSDRLMERMVTGNSDVDIWIWIIEYLAKFKKELWMLHDIFEMGPKVPDDLGEHTNEMVAFRCLAYLFDPSPGQNNNVASGVGSKVEFDLSESCVYVLQCILDEIPLLNLKPGAPELLKWNPLPFIENKRLCLPKCTLELLREASRKKSTGVLPSCGEETMGTDGDKNNQVALAGENIDGRMNGEGTSFGQGPGYGVGVVADENGTSFGQTDLCNVIPDTFEENEDGNQGTSIVDDIFRAKAKEAKLDPAEATVDNVDVCTTEAKECFDHSNNQEERMEVSRSTAYDQSEFMAPGEPQQGTSHVDNRNGQTEASHDIDILPVEMANEINFSTDAVKVLGEYPSIEAEGSKDQEKNKDQTEMDGVYDALAVNSMNPIQYEDIDGHLSSPSPNRYSCKQCNGGGKLLFCSNEGCPVMIHEKCLDSHPTYDDGNFYCPLCAYALNSSKYLKFKGQVTEAKKKLVSFLHLVNSRRLKEKARSGNQVPSSHQH